MKSKDFEIDLVVVATEAHSTALLYFKNCDWFEIAPFGSDVFTPIGTSRATAYNLGTFASGESKRYIIRYAVPGSFSDGHTLTAQPVLAREY